MIVSVSLENWMSFRDRTTFSMVATKERQHGHRVPNLKKYQARVLPIAAFYGANASGKSNFFKAMSFAKQLIVEGTKPGGLIPVERFLLDDGSGEQPSRFKFELLVNETIYEFSFAVNRKEVLEEKFVLISSTSEKVLYHRQGEKIKLHPSLDNDSFLKFAFKGTRSNQLFLTNSVSQNIDKFRSVYDWFNDNLRLITPASRFLAFEQFFGEKDSLHSAMNQMLAQLDTGIDRLGSEEVAFDQSPLSNSVKADLMDEVQEGDSVRLVAESTNERFVVTRKGDDLVLRKPVVFHRNRDGGDVKFELRQESDGSQRLFDLLPAFLDLSARASERVYLIDEIDRRLHTSLVRKMLEDYLRWCAIDKRTQLLFTTHDVMLMDQQLLRRDEMWAVERDDDGSSTLFSFSEFKDIRYDKDIRKSYLQGRLGGVPRIPLGDVMVAKKSHKDERLDTDAIETT